MTANIEASDEPGPASSLTFVGTATTVLRLGSFTVLTDPNFLHRGERAYLGYGLSSRRRTEPMAIPDDLTGLDAVVLSHLHGDHFDRRARAQLPRGVPIAVRSGVEMTMSAWCLPKLMLTSPCAVQP